MSSQNKEVVRRFENEFKNKANVGIVDDLMTESFTHHAPLPIPGISPGRAGMKQIGDFVFSMLSDIQVDIVYMLGDEDMVATRVSAQGKVKANGEQVGWTENHLYRLVDGRIDEWWGEVGPPLG